MRHIQRLFITATMLIALCVTAYADGPAGTASTKTGTLLADEADQLNGTLLADHATPASDVDIYGTLLTDLLSLIVLKGS